MSRNVKGNSRAGVGGVFRFIRHDVSDLEGSGPNGEVTFEDLWQDKAGELTPKDPDRIIQDLTVKNKILKRGLAAFSHRSLIGHASAGPYTPADIVDSPTINPFQAFILVADKTTPSHAGDARVQWSESDGASNAVIPPGPAPHPVGEGRRGILLSDTTGPGLKRVSIAYPTTDPYRKIEYIFFAQANPSGALETGDDEIDNFPIKAVGLAQDVDCGNGETNSRWGIRAVLGLAPTFQGISDRAYVHEGTGLTLYTGTTVLSSDGYVQSSQLDAYSGDLCFDGYAENEGLNGVIDQGNKWSSVDTAGPHEVGRVWATPKTLAGIRIVMPAGTNKLFAPDTFKVRHLLSTANGGSPRPDTDADWTDTPSMDFTGGSEGTEIFDNGALGKEYIFSSPISNVVGIKLTTLRAFDVTRKVEIAELYAFEEMTAVSFSSDTLRLATDGVPTFRTFNLRDTASTKSVQDLVDSINAAVRGYELEAVRSDFGFLWLRSTVAGDNSDLDLDSTVNGSTANNKLGWSTAGKTSVGTTQSVTKAQNDALTIIYRVEISGDLPQP